MTGMKTLVGMGLLLAAFASSGTHAAPGDDDFMAMREAFRVNDARKLDALAPRLKGHVLEPYAAYWQLRVRLDDAEPQAVRAKKVTRSTIWRRCVDCATKRSPS